MDKVQVSTTPHGSVQQSRHLPRKDVWTLHWSRHSMCLHWWPYACCKRILDITPYYPQRDVHPLPEVWAQGQRQKIILWCPKIWLFGLPRHLWQCYAIRNKVEAIQALAVPKTRKQLSQFIGMINFYCDMWQKSSDILSPLTALTSKHVKYKWKYKHQNCFDDIKHLMGHEVLLAYPDFNDPFEIHTDAYKIQIGAFISQKGKPIAFYSRNMNSSQNNYTTTERELLSIVAYLKEVCNILLGHQITVYTDHKI